MNYVVAADAAAFLAELRDESVDLFLIDPPYFDFVNVPWDTPWESANQYAEWLVGLCALARRKVKPAGSLIVFQPIGRHANHPIFQVVSGVEQHWHFRDWITWKKARAFRKGKGYLFARDEILWFSASADAETVTVNTSFLDEKPMRPGKYEFKRASNVWSDIKQEFRPARSCQRPLPLIARLVRTHSNPGERVVDFFAGYGTTGIVAHHLGRRFLGCELNAADAREADRRVTAAKEHAHSSRPSMK